jgi:hypothetical protein
LANTKYQDVPLTFEKGLVTEIEDSILDQGQASAIVNWEPSASGGLRARNSWSDISVAGLTANYKVRGWGIAALGGGSGYATPAIVQKGFDENNPISTTALTVTLNGTVAGNILVAVFHGVNDGTNDPDSPPSGYTERVQSVGTNVSFDNPSVRIYTKTSPGGNQTCTVDDAGSTLLRLELYELTNVGTEAPTASDSGTGFASDAMSCASPAASGIAISGGTTIPEDDWPSSPGEEAGWTTDGETVDSTFGYRATVASKVYSASPVTDTVDPIAVDSGSGDAAWAMAIWDASTAASVPASFYILMAVATATGYSIYRIPRDSIQAGTWELVDSAAVTDTSAFVSMAVSTGELVWSSSTMTNPRHVVLSTLTGANTTDLTNKAGRTVCSHKDRVFVGGSTTNPSRLYFSGIGTPHTFTTSTDFLDIGGDDGEAIEDLVSVEGLLLVCKTNRLYLISGSGVESFFVNELPGGSASTGRPAIRTPYGTIVAGPADVWVVQGGGVDPMSRPLGVGYAITGLVSTAYAQDTVLICDGGTSNVYRVNLVTGAWALEEVTAGDKTPYHLFSLQSRLYYGVSNGESKLGGTRQLSNTRQYDAPTGNTRYEASTGHAAMFGPAVRYTPRHLYLQLRNQDSTLPNELFVTVETNLGSRDFSYYVDEEIQRIYESVGWAKGVEWIKVSYTCNASATHSAIDVEKAVLTVSTEDY